jgi:hypothetical protein
LPRAILMVAALILAGCAPHMTWLRADGVAPSADPVINQQFEMDRTVCQGELQKANLSGSLRDWSAISRGSAVNQVGQGCMAQKGYVAVPEEQAVAKQQELAAIATEKARREAAAAAPQIPLPPPPSTPPQRSSTSKPKPVAQQVPSTPPQ